jgi:hypothetical protein
MATVDVHSKTLRVCVSLLESTLARDRLVGTAGISWIEPMESFLWAKADNEHDPGPPDWVVKRFRETRANQ